MFPLTVSLRRFIIFAFKSVLCIEELSIRLENDSDGLPLSEFGEYFMPVAPLVKVSFNVELFIFGIKFPAEPAMSVLLSEEPISIEGDLRQGKLFFSLFSEAVSSLVVS